MFESYKVLSPSDNLEIGALLCRPEGRAKALVQLVHGMCEHKERYQPFMEYLARNGYASVIHDHRGHGESVRKPEDLGYFYDGGWKGLVDDIRAVGQSAAAKVGDDVEIVMLGHSMGSMAVRSFAKRHDDLIRGLVVCGSPSYNPAAGVGKAVARAYGVLRGRKCRPKFVQKLSFGAFNKGIQDAKSPNAWVCSDSAVVEAYDADPLCNFQFTADGFENLFALMQDAYDVKSWHPRNPGMPVHFISGADDPCLISHDKFEAAVDAMRRAGYTRVTSHLYPKMRHEIMNETGKEAVWKDIMTFFDRVLDSSGRNAGE